MFLKYLNNPLFICFYLLAFFAGSNFICIKVGNYHLFLGRVLTFVLPFLIVNKENISNLLKAKYAKLLIGIILISIVWSGASYFWAEDKTAVIVNCFYILSGSLFGLNLVLLAFDSKLKITSNFINGWHLAWTGLVLFAYLEILFNFHIQGHFSTFLQKQQAGIPAFDSVISLFDGPNEFGVYLVVSLPFSIYFLYKKPVLFFVILMVTFQFLYRNDAKFCIIALLFFLISLIFTQFKILKTYYDSNFKKYIKFFWFVSLFMALILITNKLVVNKTEDYSIYSSFESNINGLHLDKSVNIEDSLPSMTSFEIRWNLILNGYKFLVEHPILGIGAGNFEYHMANEKGLLPTKSIVDSHNWFIQTFSENGVVIAGCYWLILFFLLITNAKYLILPNPNNLQKFLAINLLLTFGIVSNVSSSFSPSPLNWSILCLIFVALQGNKEPNETV